jgi:phosphoglycerol geranylgeranyltransferase
MISILSEPGIKKTAVLVDPDKYDETGLADIVKMSTEAKADYFLAGGSLTQTSVVTLIHRLKELSSIPVILFPGSLLQLTTEADIIFLLSLISGRNPELLIGNHVVAAPHLKSVREKIVPVGYILVSCGSVTSVEYMSQTMAIPYDKTDIAVATAIAGEMLGMKAIYLEGGSGAQKPIDPEMIAAVKKEISIPLITGGGLRSAGTIEKAYKAGADIIVIGNGCEGNHSLITEACKVRDLLNNKSHLNK